jgi:hypothetical protein
VSLLAEFISYNPKKAVDYALKWDMSRNPMYHNFSDESGDSTNFISQCLYAGINRLHKFKTKNWYYHDANDYSSSWVEADPLYGFLTTNTEKGLFAKEVSITGITIGDVIQIANESNIFDQSLLITQITYPLAYENIYVSTHDYDAHYRALNTYYFSSLRFLHIKGIYTL